MMSGPPGVPGMVPPPGMMAPPPPGMMPPPGVTPSPGVVIEEPSAKRQRTETTGPNLLAEEEFAALHPVGRMILVRLLYNISFDTSVYCIG
jgi:hypothetical protein